MDNKDVAVRISRFAKLRTRVVKGMMTVMILMVGYPVFSQKQRNMTLSQAYERWERPVASKNQTTYIWEVPVRKQNAQSFKGQQISRLYQESRNRERPVLAVKTNLLFDAVTALNVGLEVPIGERWSLAGEYIFPWWLSEKKQNSLQLISGNLELRRWFGDRDHRARMTGWFGGVFAGGGYFDLERNRKGYQGEFYMAPGLSGGYAHEIGRNRKWRMEYALGLGYLNVKYREYQARIGMDNQWHLIRQKTGNYTFVGPVSAKISLVWTLNR
jgi:hypothetical protein